MRRLIRKNVVVNLETGDVVRGVMWGHRGGYLTLRNAEVFGSGQFTAADGEIVVERRRVSFVQVVG